MKTLAIFQALAVIAVVCSTKGASFPSLDEVKTGYTTEVLVTDVIQAVSAYAVEYFSKVERQGSVKISFQGDEQSVYYDNKAFQIYQVINSNCTVWDQDISEYAYKPIFLGWLNKNPLIIGPSAPLWYAQTKKGSIKEAGTEEIRNIDCDTFELPIVNKRENLTIRYYFAQKDWLTPYKYGELRIPIRIRIFGVSSSDSKYPDMFQPVDLINDFIYFKPIVNPTTDLLPPIGLGCKGKKEANDIPKIPSVFQYSAEVVDLLEAKEHDKVEIKYEKVWYDYIGRQARLDRFTMEGITSNLYDFNTGTTYKTENLGPCNKTALRDSEFQTYDYGMTSRLKEPKEALNLDGTFYDMGKREIRGLTCDVYESVKFQETFNGKKYYKLVTTAYFTKNSTTGTSEGPRVLVYMVINGYTSPTNKTLQLQYNIFEFKDFMWPEIYSSFKLERCFTNAETEHFVLIMDVPAKIAATMKDQDEQTTLQLKYTISKVAKVSNMRISDLKIDYKTTKAYARGVLLERPPARLQFFEINDGPTISHDRYLKKIESTNLEQCSNACVDEGDFLCKGFYLCNSACFLKSTDPFEKEEEGTSTDLGYCTEYIRAVRDSTNFRQSYLKDALENLQKAAFNGRITVDILVPFGVERLKVTKLIIGEPEINPCSRKNGGCSQLCHFKNDDIECSCREGYSLHADGKSCQKINPCSRENGGCSQLCHFRNDRIECSCREGYSLHADGKSCQKKSGCDTEKGEEFQSCGSACPPTCDNYNESRPCTLQCVIGCGCPRGTVRRESDEYCVKPEEC